MRGVVLVPRRAVAMGAEDTTADAEKQLQRLKLKEMSQERKARRRKEREEQCPTVQVLNNDLSKSRGLRGSGRCKSCWPACELPQSNKYELVPKRCGKQAVKNNNLFADNPGYPTRRQTEPGGCLTETKIALLNQDLAQLVDTKKNKLKSQQHRDRRSSRRRPTYPGHASPGELSSGHASPLPQLSDRTSSGVYGRTSLGSHIAGDISPVVGVSRKEACMEPSYAYHADESKYLYVHAEPRKTPFEEPKARRKRKSKTRRARDASAQEKSEKDPGKVGGATSVVHRHEHVHHHYHHYGEKR